MTIGTWKASAAQVLCLANMDDNTDFSDFLSGKRIALVHDWLTTFGGAERVVATWKDLLPEAPIYTSVFDRSVMGKYFDSDQVRTSRLQKLPGVKHYYRKLLPFFPAAFEEFDLREFDIVLSSSTSCAKGVLTTASTFHVAYVNTPMRYAWDLYHEYLADSGPLTRWAMRRQMPKIRHWDALSANRVDLFLGNSTEVARRIKKVYKRDSIVVHPPVETGHFTPANPEESPKKGADLGERYLILTRLVPYKRADIAVEACTKAGLPLDVIGSGPELGRLKVLAGPTVKFHGFLSDEEIRDKYRSCRAFLFPGFEDFGITPLEAQGCGRPVLAFGKGGALDTVVDGKTGLFFPKQDPESLIEAMKDFEAREWSPQEIHLHAEGFGRSNHLRNLLSAMKNGYEEFLQ